MKTNSLKILVIGGSGFVSGTLARTAVARGHKVWAVTRGEKPLPEDVIGLTADRRHIEHFKRVICETKTRWDLVVDCIGFESEDARTDIQLFKDCAEHLVFISSDFVFDPKHRTFPQDQDNPHFIEYGYGGKKRLCELEFLITDTTPMNWTILRPCHIYGPGSKLGCLPMHSRDPDLIERVKAGEVIKLVGGGHFLQQPIFAADLVELILSCAANPKTFGQIYNTAGPDIIESRQYYQIIADLLGVGLKIEEIPVTQYVSDCPAGNESFICHRIYNLKKLHRDDLKVPATPIATGLQAHIMALLK